MLLFLIGVALMFSGLLLARLVTNVDGKYEGIRENLFFAFTLFYSIYLFCLGFKAVLKALIP